MVADAVRVLADPEGDLVGAEQALAFEALATEQALEQGGEGAAEPAGHGDAESFLGPFEDRRGQVPGRRALQQPLGLAAAVLERRGQCRDRVHQRGVEEGGPDFQAAGHARPVHLGQDVLGQVGILVQGQGPRQGVAARRQAPRPPEMLGLDVDGPPVDQEPAISGPENEPSQR